MEQIPLHWLPELGNIAPPEIHLKEALIRESVKISSGPEMPIRKNFLQLEGQLRSWKPPLKTAYPLIWEGVSLSTNWTISSDKIDEHVISNHVMAAGHMSRLHKEWVLSMTVGYNIRSVKWSPTALCVLFESMETNVLNWLPAWI